MLDSTIRVVWAGGDTDIRRNFHEQQNAGELPFKPNSFDLVVSTLVFHHLPTAVKRQALCEIYRILRNDGRFLLIDYGKVDSILWKFLFGGVKPSRLPETSTMQDNLAGKLPNFLSEVGLIFHEARPQYRGIQFFQAKKS